MTTQEVADKLMSYCKEANWYEALDELYAPNAVSIEMAGQTNFPPRVEGLENMKAKGKKWESMVEQFHGITVDGPIVAGDHFTCSMVMDITMKGAPRMQNSEIALYKVADGKIVSEQFFYPLQ